MLFFLQYYNTSATSHISVWEAVVMLGEGKAPIKVGTALVSLFCLYIQSEKYCMILSIHHESKLLEDASY